VKDILMAYINGYIFIARRSSNVGVIKIQATALSDNPFAL
jgi:hypothetical protein